MNQRNENGSGGTRDHSALDYRILEAELRRRKVAVYRAADDTWLPIPVAVTPTVIAATEWDRLTRDARLILDAFPKVLRWLQNSGRRQLRERMFAGLPAIENPYVALDPDTQWGHVTIRMDLFWHLDEIKIIEVNCTIPAMQAYSDNVIEAWIQAGGVSDQRSNNVAELLESILAMYRADGGVKTRPSIVILRRDGDSQSGELLSLRRLWSAAGYKTTLATPDQLSRVGDSWVVAGESHDIVYRHIFAWRLTHWPFAAELARNRSAHIYNPVSAHYETKAFLALVSQLSSDDALSKDALLLSEEVDAIRRRVPWSRVLGNAPGGVTFRAVGDRLAQLVLKRSVGYGGHQVIMGSDWDSLETQDRLRALMGRSGKIDFPAFSDWASEFDQSLWIAQERMSGARRKTEVITADGVEEWDAWYDASIFLNTRTASICRGGVSRISRSPVVNIGTGGGLAPFFLGKT